ncbi:MAG: glycosyltransferase [Fervidobacterium sp.]
MKSGSKNTKIRLLQLITRSDWAGGQKVLYSIVYGLKKHYPENFEVEVACGPESGVLIDELGKIGIKVHVVNSFRREISLIDDLKAYSEVVELLKKGNYDIVHTHSSKAGIIGRIAAKKHGVKKVIHTYHGFWGIEQYNGLKKKLLIFAERIASKYADYLVFLCNRDMQKAIKWKIGKPDQYKVIPNAIVPEPPAHKGTLRKELNLPDNVKIVGNVARLDPPKNPLRFLKVAEEVLKIRDDIVFVWIGGSVVDNWYGKQVSEFLQQRSQLRDKIFFLPFRKDATKLMADFDVLLLTSDSEGMPLVVLEALSQKVPVVSTDVGCVSEIVGEKYVEDENKLKEIIIDVLQNTDNIPHTALSFKDFIDHYLQIYKEESNE